MEGNYLKIIIAARCLAAFLHITVLLNFSFIMLRLNILSQLNNLFIWGRTYSRPGDERVTFYNIFCDDLCLCDQQWLTCEVRAQEDSVWGDCWQRAGPPSESSETGSSGPALAHCSSGQAVSSCFTGKDRNDKNQTFILIHL